MKRYRSLLITIALLLAVSFTVQAETRYISDRLVVSVRSNMGADYQVLEHLATDAPVEILEEVNGFVKVRTEAGNEGYIRSQYVSKALPKPIQIEQLQQQKAELEKRLQQQQQQLQDTAGASTSNQTELNKLSKELEQTSQQLVKVKQDYAQLQKDAANVINLATERDTLLEENSEINKELLILKEENRSFHRSNMIQWFLAGGGVFFGGWLVGKLSRKKRGYGRY